MVNNNKQVLEKLLQAIAKVQDKETEKNLCIDLAESKLDDGALFISKYSPYDTIRAISNSLIEASQGHAHVDINKIEKYTSSILDSVFPNIEENFSVDVNAFYAMLVSAMFVGDLLFYSNDAITNLLEENKVDKDLATYLTKVGKSALKKDIFLKISDIANGKDIKSTATTAAMDIDLLKKSYLEGHVKAHNIADLLIKTNRVDLLSKILSFVENDDFLLISNMIKEHMLNNEEQDNEEQDFFKQELNIRRDINKLTVDEIASHILNLEIDPEWVECNIPESKMYEVKKEVLKKTLEAPDVDELKRILTLMAQDMPEQM